MAAMDYSGCDLSLPGSQYNHSVHLSGLMRCICPRLDWFQNIFTLMQTVGNLSRDVWQVEVPQ